MTYKIMIRKKENFYGEVDYSFDAKNKREVVGLLMTIMDNFDPGFVEIYEEGAFNEIGSSDIKQFVMIKEVKA